MTTSPSPVESAARVTHRSGHTQNRDLPDLPEKDRSKKLDYLTGIDCTSCWMAAKDAETAQLYGEPDTHVAYACGHEATVTLDVKKSGQEWTPRGRRWFVETMATDGTCADCTRAAHRAAAAADRERHITEFETRTGLPDLDGTERQTAWARTIRFAAFTIDTGDDGWELRDLGPDMEQAIDLATGATESPWWIDHRDTLTPDLDLATIITALETGLASGDAGVPA